MAGYTYLNEFMPYASELAQSTQKLSVALAVAAGMVGIGSVVSKRLRTAEGIEKAIVPEKKPGLFSMVDALCELFYSYHDSFLGKENRKHAPFVATIFFFILLLNLIGLIPGMPAATTTVWVNLGLAIVVFIHFNYYGIKEHGLIGYLKHFAGPVWWIAPFFFVLEIMSTLLRVLTLNLRLYWNITADHMVLEAFVGLFGSFGAHGLAAIFYGLGAFVSFMQAYVFATLTMVYILLATQHEEH